MVNSSTGGGLDPAVPADVALTEMLSMALSARTREAFTALLTDDVRWGGEQSGGNECTDRAQAGDSYGALLDAGVTLGIDDLYQADDDVFNAHLHVQSSNPDEFPERVAVRLTLRQGLIADICILDNPPPTIELLYVDDCPHHEELLTNLRRVLAEHGIRTPVTQIRISDDEQARQQRFLGSPTLRVDGLDVEPAFAWRSQLDGDDEAYGLQCRLYPAADGNSTTGMPQEQWLLDALVDNPIHLAAVEAVHTGDLSALRDLLAAHPDLATTRLRRHGGRTLLHVATDWPGHYPQVAATISALVQAGADPDAPCLGQHPETPLHWAASSDDLAALDALIDAGANINAPGAVIAGGTPMADATAFGQWNAARRLHERGARTNLFEAAALGLVAEVQRHLDSGSPTPEDITSSFWGACHGGRVPTAAVLLEHGADINWIGYDDLTPLGTARRADAIDVVAWLELHGATSA